MVVTDKNKEKAWFLKKIYTLLNAGIDLATILTGLIETSPSMAKRVQVVLDQLEGGLSFAEAVKVAYPLTSAEESLISAAQATGKLGPSLKALVEYHEKSAEFRKDVKRTLLRPTLTLALAIGVLIMVSYVVVPALSDALQFKSKPAMFMVMESTKNVLPIIGIAVTLAVVAGLTLYLLRPLRFYEAMYSLPIAGSIKKLGVVNVFLGTLAILCDGGVSLGDAMKIAEKEANPYIGVIIREISRKMFEAGATVREAFRASGLFSFYVLELVDSAEKTGDFAKYFKEANGLVGNEFTDNKTKLLPAIEMAAMVVVGTVVMTTFLTLAMSVQDMGQMVFK